MRTVLMNEKTACDREPALVRKLAGHLWARLMELEPCGMTVLEDEDGARSSGVVSIQWDKGDNGAMVGKLAEGYHIYVGQSGEGAPVTFAIGQATTFADIDYVQGAVWEVLEAT